ncbi:unnamed protein product [Rotaria socialis]|uniref:Uncharacterized protein n=1 Tax=Rotaria socialis TaxID=392032 RepID=A0A821ECJ5_9BILA|nr:unnamed protein product [Rotaria socialis]CAF4635016.1 unnamed protein product [Rotaria socialis]
MSSPSSEANVSIVFIAKCSQCKVKSALESCEIYEDAKCKKCTTQHIMEAEELWDPIGNSAMNLYDKKTVPPRRLKFSTRRRYPDVEKRIARVTDSKRRTDDILAAINGPRATRETRMEAVAWITVCQFNCCIFGGFVRDWIVGGYISKPAIHQHPTAWIKYTKCIDKNGCSKNLPHLNKEIVPNDIDCYLLDSDFNIDQYVKCLREYGIKCEVCCEIWRGYVLLVDEHLSPFTMDMILPDATLISHKYRIIDMKVNNLFVEKDYTCALGLRSNLAHKKIDNLCVLETIVENMKSKRFVVLREFYVKDRIEKMVKRGWTEIK